MLDNHVVVEGASQFAGAKGIYREAVTRPIDQTRRSV
jgi:hypothetical protein